MSFLTTLNPRERWQDHEPKSSNSFENSHFQQTTHHTDKICSNFLGNIQLQPQDMRNTLEHGQALSSEVDTNVLDSGSFMQSYMPTVSATPNSSELNVVSSREGCGSLSNEGSSELNVNFPFLSQKRHDRPNDPTAKKMVMPPTPNSGNMHAINSLGYTQSEYQRLHSINDRIQIHDNDHEVSNNCKLFLAPLISSTR